MVHVCSTETVPGWQVVSSFGLVYAQPGLFRGVDGAIKDLTKAAENKGANAIVACRISANSNTVVVYGTAVVLAKEREE